MSEEFDVGSTKGESFISLRCRLPLMKKKEIPDPGDNQNNGLRVVPTHLNNIDILRIVAAVGVVSFHAVGMININNLSAKSSAYMSGINSLQPLLASGVDLFFVISGFVMIQSQQYRKSNSIRFIKGRIRRIVPIYWLLTIAAIIQILLTNALGLSNITFPSFRSIWTSFLFITHFNGVSSPIIFQGWTLEFEMLFYIIFALSLGFSQMKRILVTNIIVLILLSLFTPNGTYFYEFIIGILLGTLFQKYRLSIGAGYSLICIGISLSIIGKYLLENFSNVIRFGISSGLIIYGSISLPNVKQKVFIFLGKISYTTYLVHGFMISLIYQFIKRIDNLSLFYTNVSIIASLIISLGTGSFLYWFFDKPTTEKLKAKGW